MTDANTELTPQISCQECGDRGRRIDPETIHAQVVPTRLEAISEFDGWRLCGSSECEVVYFCHGDAVVLGQTVAVPFHKGMNPERLVCFCFEHSVSELEADFALNGKSLIQAAIKAACMEQKDDCRRKNPQGRCCLGNVGKVLKQTTSAIGCCGTSD